MAAASPFLNAAAAESPSAAAPARDSEIGFKDGKYVLPPLPYAYNALEPHIDEQTMHLHHDLHHAAYVKGANAAAEALAAIAAGTGDAALIHHWNNELSFHLSGHVLHTIFWNNMTPRAAAPAAGPFLDAVNATFGSVEHLEKLFSATALAVQGSGWAILGYDATSARLQVFSAEKHQNLTLQGVRPLLVLDVWEHAYYLKYQNKRADYVKNFLPLINHEDVAARYAKAVAGA